ncbi:MAG TPA: hypothetical protein VL463_13615 [Kofleriaceae bacterium]|nr:hypothetical protein [Kofleriaceae bacterium]
MTKPRDIDLMQLADGELDAASAARVESSLDDRAREKLGALRDLGTVVRGHLELRADEADARLARMWGEIDKQISPAAKVPAKKKAGAWERFTSWIDSHRGHVMTGLVSAGAVAAIMWWVRPGGSTTVYVPEGGGSGTQPASLKRQAPQVESLDTPEGSSGNVFTIEGDGDDDGSTTVILVTPDDVEGT